MRIPAPVHPLVVVQDAEQLALEVAPSFEDRHADLGMRLHQGGLRLVERSMLLEDRVRDAKLANVVEQAGSRQDAQLSGRHPHLPSDLHAQLRDPAIVTLGLAILDLDRRHQRRDDVEVELLDVDGDLQLESRFDHRPERSRARALDYQRIQSEGHRRQHQQVVVPPADGPRLENHHCRGGVRQQHEGGEKERLAGEARPSVDACLAHGREEEQADAEDRHPGAVRGLCERQLRDQPGAVDGHTGVGGEADHD